MRVSFALIASAIVAPSAIAAPTSIESENSNVLVKESAEVPAEHSFDSVIISRGREDQSVHFSGLRQRESEALSGLVSDFRNIFAKGSFDYPEFAKKTNEWSGKLAEIEKNVKGKLPGEFSLDSVLEFTQRQFNYMKKASEYQAYYKNENYFGSDFVVDVLEMRAKIGSFYSSDGTISPSIKGIDAQIEQLSMYFSEMNSDFEDEQENIIIHVKSFYRDEREDVTKALEELKQKAADRKPTGETCGEDAQYLVAGPR